jgi:putative component of toxin-antitoxin plasmid stabilization module
MQVIRTPDFKIWLSSESAKIQALVESRVFRIEHYDHLGDAKHLGDGLSELRWTNGLRDTLPELLNELFCSFTVEEKMRKKTTSKKRELSLNDIPIR